MSRHNYNHRYDFGENPTQHSSYHYQGYHWGHYHQAQYPPYGPPADDAPNPPLPTGSETPASEMQFRSVDGSGNNLASPDFNSAGGDFTRIGAAHFLNDDGHTPLGEPDGFPDPRDISNIVVGQGGSEAAEAGNPEGLSGMMYAWGQFIDHDLDMSQSDGVNHIDISIPIGDPNFPDGTSIPLTRAVINPDTGTADHPATAVNAITGWLDASMVYGSDEAAAASLRTADGHMTTSAGGNLPVDHSGPMGPALLAGDVRAQENPSLAALQTLFVREHNYQVDQLHAAHPDWTGDQLYDHARAIVGAEIANITYNEFLPHLLGPGAIDPYQGYDPTVDPRITEEFAGAAYRFGHSIVDNGSAKIAENGAELSSVDLKDAFFQTPTQFAADSGADGIIRELAGEASPALDARIVDGLRNFLFDTNNTDLPDSLDLAAINIQRGHDLGLGTLNETREALGLAPYTSFDQLAGDDGATVAALREAFGTANAQDNIDKVDLWTGGLAENHAPGAFVGDTFQTIIANQFEALRDGDRFFYQNPDVGFDQDTLARIENTTLSDIVSRNTSVGHIQDDSFVAFQRVSGAQGGVAAEDHNAPLLIVGANGSDTLTGGPAGDYLFAGKGRQTLIGGEGDDKFVVQAGTKGKIVDFDPAHDELWLKDSTGQHEMNVAQADIYERHGHAVVDLHGAHIALIGVSVEDLFEVNPVAWI